MGVGGSLVLSFKCIIRSNYLLRSRYYTSFFIPVAIQIGYGVFGVISTILGHIASHCLALPELFSAVYLFGVFYISTCYKDWALC